MSIQDKAERILREMHVMISRAPVSEADAEYVLVNKKEMQRQLGYLSETVSEMLEEYELTAQSRNRGEMEAEKHRMEIVRNANHQAQDIYAASVIYSEDALGRIQDIIGSAEEAAKEVLRNLSREMEEEKRVVRRNQLELITQLEDMKDTAKYMKLIEERNREIAKAKAKSKEGAKDGSKREFSRQEEGEPKVPSISPEIKINEEYFEKTGLTPDGLPKDMEAEFEEFVAEAVVEEMPEEKPVYEKPVIKVNPKYFEKLESMAEESGQDAGNGQPEKTEKTEKLAGFFSFGRKS